MIKKTLLTTLFLLGSNEALSRNDCTDIPNTICEFGTHFSKFEFLPKSFENRNYGALSGNIWSIPNADNVRAGCFASTPNNQVNLSEVGDIDVSIKLKGSYSAYIQNLTDSRNVKLFTLKVTYTDLNGRNVETSKIVDVTALGPLLYLGSVPEFGDFYISNLETFKTVRIDDTIPVDNGATNIRVHGCNFQPSLVIDVSSITIKTINL